MHTCSSYSPLFTNVAKEERARSAERGCMAVGTREGSPGFDRTPSMGVDDEWWFAEGSLEEIPYRKDGDGDVDSRL